MRQKTCQICGKPFAKQRMGQKACSIECAIVYGRKQLGKRAAVIEQAKRKEIRERKEKLKTRSDWMKEAQTEFNAYIRERDKHRPCICCGLPLELNAIGGGYDAGHYRSVGSAPHLRFDERNAHGQRKQCNRYGAGRAVDYRIGLIARIGREAVEALEADQTPRKYSIDDLKQIRDTYRKKLRTLRKSSNESRFLTEERPTA